MYRDLKQLEANLWQSADTLRANSDLKSSEYSTPVLGLIFLKFADNRYRLHETEIQQEYEQLKGTRPEKAISEIAIAKCGFYLPEHARYDYLLALPEKEDIAQALKAAMVVSLDKFTVVKMYDKVQHYWKAEIKNLMGRIQKSTNDIEKIRLKKILEFMRDTEMAVVVSEEAGEEEKFSKQGLAIKPHRDRMNKLDAQGHDIEYQFKDATNSLRLVFVCAMWLTGFDVPTLSTLYLDKPMKDHTLMQAIARANRVTSYSINNVTKTNGEIIDYYNVFRNMKRALADYALGDDVRSPIQEKSNLFSLLDDAIALGFNFCQELGIDLESILNTQDTFKNLEQFNQFADTLLQKDEWRKAFVVYDNTITSLYEACKPEILEERSRQRYGAISLCQPVAVFQYLRGVIDSIIERRDTSNVSIKIAELLDVSVVADNQNFSGREYGAEYKIIQKGKVWDLSQLDFFATQSRFSNRYL